MTTAIKLPQFQPGFIVAFHRRDEGGDMKGTVRLTDGTELSFDYFDWVEPYNLGNFTREDDQQPYRPYDLQRGREPFYSSKQQVSWPYAGAWLLVFVEDGAIKFWMWPRHLENLSRFGRDN